MEVLRWARANGCEWNEEACLGAAQRGHLVVLQWLRSNGCPWDSDTCYHAVEEGHVNVLRWARENGASWTAEIRDWAATALGYTDDLGNLVDND